MEKESRVLSFLPFVIHASIDLTVKALADLAGHQLGRRFGEQAGDDFNAGQQCLPQAPLALGLTGDIEGIAAFNSDGTFYMSGAHAFRPCGDGTVCAMIEDGAAMCEFYAWFEAALADPAHAGRITELTVDEHLSAARSRRAGFVGLSFPVIAGFNANGAMPHYRATAESHAVINPPGGAGGLLLIDSGGQYVGGTTDVTRVWPIGEVSDAQRCDYTRVLKGTLALSRTRFPVGTLSPMLDAIARAPLWQHGLDYGHGTGHGVGYFLNVHEGPQSISKAVPDVDMAMQPGMVTSIEPGLYRPGQWGIRIENLVLNVPATLSDAGSGPSGVTPFGEFLEFETLTLCPIDTRCIERSLMSDDDIAWLNTYHATVFERLSPRVSGAALAWLTERTKAF